MALEASKFAGAPWWQRPVASPTKVAGRTPAKGEHGGECNRIACSQELSYWFNETNGRYYCSACAKRFNDVSRRHGERPLCELRL